MNTMRISSGLLSLSAGIMFALPAGAADQFQMNGSWLQRRGNTVQIPVAPPSAGVLGSGIASQTGADPRSITLPTNAFKRFALPGLTNTITVPVPTLAQLATNFQANAPAATTLLGGVGNKLKKDAWTATRGFGSFNWCPGATKNPSCLSRAASPGKPGSGAPPGSGTYHGIVKYSNANPDQFGGTMSMVLSTPIGNTSIGRNVGGNFVLHLPIVGGGKQVMGGKYAQTNTAYLPPGIVSSPIGRTSPAGVITVPGPTFGTAGTPSTNLNFGMPWTTGMIVASGSNGGGANTTWAFTGSDTRTPLGSGMVSLVAGGLGQRIGAGLASGLTFVNVDSITMTFSPPPPPVAVPAMTPAVTAAVAFAMLSIGFVLRRRLF